MVISRSLKPPNLPTLKLEGKELEYNKSIIILGTQFDDNLSFTEYIIYLASRNTKQFTYLRRVASFLIDRECTMFYICPIRSVVEYSPFV